jgi:hypothetical protein
MTSPSTQSACSNQPASKARLGGLTAPSSGWDPPTGIRDPTPRLRARGHRGGHEASIRGVRDMDDPRNLSGSRLVGPDSMGRVGIEPTTLGLRVPCSTS